jgi:hypothetical protein
MLTTETTFSITAAISRVSVRASRLFCAQFITCVSCAWYDVMYGCSDGWRKPLYLGHRRLVPNAASECQGLSPLLCSIYVCILCMATKTHAYLTLLHCVFADPVAKQCADGCANAGYDHFGVEDRTACFCGNGEPTTKSLLANQCKKCVDNAAHQCGGPSRMSVYSIVKKGKASPRCPHPPCH